MPAADLPRLSQSPRDPAFVQDPYPFYDRARALGPLFLWEDYGFPCAAGHAEVGALLRDRRFGRELPADLKPAAPAAPRRLLRPRRPLDARPRAARPHPPPRPRAARLHLAPHRRPRARRSRRSRDALIDRLARRRFDLHRRLRRAAAGRGDRPPARRARGDGAASSSPGRTPWSPCTRPAATAPSRTRANAAARDFAAFLRAHVAARRRRPADDLITALIAAEARRRPPRHRGAGRHLRPPAQRRPRGDRARHRQRRRRDPRAPASTRPASSPTPPPTAATVEEVLRFDPPLHLFTRFALEDAEAFGHRFRPRRHRRLPARRRQPRPGALPRPAPLRPRPRPRPAPRLRRRHPLLRRRAARPRRARHRPADPLRAPARPRARRAAGLRRPLPLPRPRRPLLHRPTR